MNNQKTQVNDNEFIINKIIWISNFIAYDTRIYLALFGRDNLHQNLNDLFFNLLEHINLQDDRTFYVQ